MNRLEEFPPVYWLSTHNAIDRQRNLIQQFDQYNITDHTMIEGYNAKDCDFTNNLIVRAQYLASMRNIDIAVIMSHLKMIKHWYYNSSHPYVICVEDDINLKNCEYWNFTWKDFVSRLPNNWSVIQLCLIRDDHISNVKFQPIRKYNWSAAAYLITREYAKKLVETYCIGDSYQLDIPNNPHTIPYVENVLFDISCAYTVPLFTETANSISNFYGQGRSAPVADMSLISHQDVTNWWRKNGSKTSIDTIMGLDKSIPLIGTIVCENSFWVTRLLASINYPVDEFFIINNGNELIVEELDNLKNINNPNIRKISISHLPNNIGVASAWNLIIKSYIFAPYWVIVRDDVAFEIGFLDQLVATATSDDNIGIIHGNKGIGIGNWDAFLIRDSVIQKFGLFDENFYPDLYHDIDYLMRLINDPIKKVNELPKQYYRKYNHASQYQEDTASPYQLKLKMVHLSNVEYMNTKWGVNWLHYNPYSRPFNNIQIPLSYTSYNLNFVRDKYVGF